MNRYVSIIVVLSLLAATPCRAFICSVSTVGASKVTSNHNSKLMATPLREENKLVSVTDKNSRNSHHVQKWFSNSLMAAAMVSSISSSILLLTAAPQTAYASYSAYAHREDDWQQRVAQNAVQVSNPKLLRDQLRQIAPMNEERSRIFCPNGPSAAVTPLMENRCSDVRQATPSVFGRSDDVVGNSIPGFSKEWTSSIYSSSSADPGGLPEYGFTKSSRK